MSKYDFLTQFECQNSISIVKTGFSDHFECQNRILIVNIGFSDSIRISKNEKQKTKSEKRKSNELHLACILYDSGHLLCKT